eukprot:TRINITY_DN11607_c0_g1_i1.p1 TRINITY_DN11607_c0_g1~~TRINITY_DN11607_c0_g1_i1.p1  ORF type:complete len:638 (-),score=51.44 TRINITY_DN11607_c0_g1_i1:177-1973(-)
MQGQLSYVKDFAKLVRYYKRSTVSLVEVATNRRSGRYSREEFEEAPYRFFETLNYRFRNEIKELRYQTDPVYFVDVFYRIPPNTKYMTQIQRFQFIDDMFSNNSTILTQLNINQICKILLACRICKYNMSIGMIRIILQQFYDQYQDIQISQLIDVIFYLSGKIHSHGNSEEKDLLKSMIREVVKHNIEKSEQDQQSNKNSTENKLTSNNQENDSKQLNKLLSNQSVISPIKQQKLLPKQIADVCWACAKLYFKDEEVIKYLLNHYLDILDVSKLSDTANILWACDVLSFYDEDFFYLAGNQIENSLNDCTPWVISTALRCYGNHGYIHPTLLQKFEQFILNQKDLSSYKSDDLWRIIAAYAKLGYTDDKIELYEKLTNQILNLRNSISYKVWILCGWGLGTAGMINSNFREFWEGFESSFQNSDSWQLNDPMYLSQFHQIYVMLNLMPGQKLLNLDNLPEQLVKKSSVISHQRSKKGGHVSDIHFEIFGVLRSLGFEVELEYSLRPGLMVDCYCKKLNRNFDDNDFLDDYFVVEVDGPSHYSVNLPDVLLGKTKLRNRLFDAINVKYFTVSLFEWKSLTNREDQNQYMINKLQQLKG